jgi:hypothetical protein
MLTFHYPPSPAKDKKPRNTDIFYFTYLEIPKKFFGRAFFVLFLARPTRAEAMPKTVLFELVS